MTVNYLDRTMATMADKHIYWGQASLLAQIGLLDPAGLPIPVNRAAKILDLSLPNLIYNG